MTDIVRFQRPATSPWLAGLVALYAVLVALPMPIFPGLGLDNSWVLTAEYASRHHAVFGHDYVFTYGPLAFLSTHLFDASTYAWTLAFDVGILALWLSPMLVSRRGSVLLAYLAVSLMSPLGFDPRIVAALFAFTITAVRRPGLWVVAVAAFLAPISLSKLSFGLAALPILVLIDAHGLMGQRRLPLATIAFVAVVLLCLALTGQPASGWASGAANDLEVIAGYSSAMQLAIGTGGLAALVAILGATGLLLGWACWARLRRGGMRRVDLASLTIAAALLWSCYIGFKMGYVRADGHTLITWNLLLLLIPPILAALAAERPIGRVEELSAAALLIGFGVITLGFTRHFSDPKPAIGTLIADRAATLYTSPIASLAWLTPQRWAEAREQRRAGDARLARAFPPTVQGRVDAIPFQLSQIIASGLNYAPRPVPQSYSSYTPALQRLDADFLADPARAPDTLLVQMGYDVDYHMPTLALGPSLSLVTRWYDPVGIDPGQGVILRRRSVARTVEASPATARRFAFADWVSLPSTAPDQRVMAAIAMDKALPARLMGLVAREPALTIELRRVDGSIQSMRFVPGMAGVAVGLSPMMRAPGVDMLDHIATHQMLFPRAGSDRVAPIAAFRIVGDPTARYGFTGGTVRLWIERYR